MPMDKSRYPVDWKTISARVRERANNKCEQCGAVRGTLYQRAGATKPTKIVLTVHHINGQPMDCRDENLLCLCAACHLAADRHKHVYNAHVTRRRKKIEQGQRELPL